MPGLSGDFLMTVLGGDAADQEDTDIPMAASTMAEVEDQATEDTEKNTKSKTLHYFDKPSSAQTVLQELMKATMGFKCKVSESKPKAAAKAKAGGRKKRTSAGDGDKESEPENKKRKKNDPALNSRFLIPVATSTDTADDTDKDKNSAQVLDDTTTVAVTDASVGKDPLMFLDCVVTCNSMQMLCCRNDST